MKEKNPRPQEKRSELTCAEVRSLLFAYLDQEVEERIIYQIEQHRTTCPNCTKVMRSYRLVIEYLRRTEEEEVPEEIHQRLLRLID